MKKSVKLLSVLAFVLLFTVINCQKDDNYEKPQSETAIIESNTFKNVSASEIPDVINFIQSRSNEEMTFRIQYSNNQILSTPDGVESSPLELSIEDLEVIAQATNEFGKSNYAFKLSKDINDDRLHFINLIVKEYADTYYLVIAKYLPEQEWFLSTETDMSTFTGEILLYNYQGYFKGYNVLNNGVGGVPLYGQAAHDALGNNPFGNVVNNYSENMYATSTPCPDDTDNNDNGGNDL